MLEVDILSMNFLVSGKADFFLKYIYIFMKGRHVWGVQRKTYNHLRERILRPG